MLRKLIAKFTTSLNEHVVSVRHKFELPIKISIEPDRNTGRLRMPHANLSISGLTRDLSKTGIAFIVSDIRLREYYLVGENRILNAELDLPNGKVKMQIIGQRYEQFGEHLSESKFLVGASIAGISEQDRETYEFFLRTGKKRKRKSFALGIYKS